jgi:hypothetical protein
MNFIHGDRCDPERDYQSQAEHYRMNNIVTLDPGLAYASWARLNSDILAVNYALLPVILHAGLTEALKKTAGLTENTG